MIPKQIINKIFYGKIFYNFLFNKKFEKYDLLFKKLKNILELNENIIFLGRARTGIYLAVKQFLNKEKPKVLMSPFTIPDVINMVKCAGGTPFFLDFDAYSTFINIEELNQVLEKKECSVMILTHYNINEKNYERISNLCKKYDVSLVEDCAISLGGKANNLPVGKLSDAAIFSFSAFKFLNFFYGGLIVFKKESNYEKIKNEIKNWKKLSFIDYLEPIINTLKFQILTSKLFYTLISKIFYLFFFNFTSNKKKYISFEFDKMNESYFKLPADPFYFEINKKIDFFRSLQDHRRKISKIYLEKLNTITIPNNLSIDEIDNSSCYNYIVIVKNKLALRKKLASEGIDLGFSMYPNCHLNKQYENIKGKSYNVNFLVNNSIFLPTHHLINESYARKISEKILLYNS